MWTAGEVAIDLDASWPAPLLARVVTAFSAPAAHVALLPWPTPDQPDAGLDVGREVGVEDELAEAVAAIADLERTVRVAHVPLDPTDTRTGSRPFWADFIDTDRPAFTPIPTTPAPTSAATATTSAAGSATSTVTVPGGDRPRLGAADLVITSVAPEVFASGPGSGHGGRSADLLALYAARLLRVGGTLVILTHCDWSSGELTDPTGAIVTAAQHADLLYLQHIVAIHTPLRDGRFDPDSDFDLDSDRDATTAAVRNDDTTDDTNNAATRECAVAIGAPEPHRRIHSDVLVFAQPADH